MNYTVRFDFQTDPPLSRAEQILLLEPFVAVLQGKATGAYHLRIDAGSHRRTETCGVYDKEVAHAD